MTRALPRLFLTALYGVHLMITLALASLGPLAVAAWVLATAGGGFTLVRRTRATTRPAGATCDCCTSTVHDPVEVR